MDDERIVFEASLGAANEDQGHIQDATLKLLRILTFILVLKAYDLKNVWYLTKIIHLRNHEIKVYLY